VVMGMAANPRGAHQAGELSLAELIGRKCWSDASTSDPSIVQRVGVTGAVCIRWSHFAPDRVAVHGLTKVQPNRRQ